MSGIVAAAISRALPYVIGPGLERRVGVVAAFALALTGCRCSRAWPARADDDAVARLDASPREVDATRASDERRSRWVVLGARVVDLEERRLSFTLPDPPRATFVDRDVLYAQHGHLLTAIELPTGKTRWEVEDLSTAQVIGLVGDGRRVFLVWSDVIDAYDVGSGARARLATTPPGRAFAHAAVVGDRLVAREDSGPIVLLDVTSGAATKTIGPVTASPSDGRLFVSDRAEGGFGAIDEVDDDFVARGFDRSGTLQWKERFPRNDRTPIAGGTRVDRVLTLRATSSRHALFSSDWFSSRPKTIVLRMTDGARVASLGDEESALVEDERGELEGLLRADDLPKPVRMLDAKGAVRWSTTAIAGDGESLATVSIGARLYVARYGRITSGSALVAVDRATGALAWKGDVVQLLVPHSAYQNEVTLRAFGDDVALIGVESGGAYVQLFDGATGVRTFAQVDHAY